MTVTMMEASAATRPQGRWIAIVAAMGVGLAALGVLFRTEAQAAVGVWISSSAYSHCFFVLPIALWLAWERRDRLPGVPVRPTLWVVVAALPLGLAWLVAERLGIMEGRQLAALGLIELLFLAVLGWPMFRVMLAPLAYLVFLVPFGAFLTGSLQRFTAWFTVTGLDVLGIPNVSDGFTIEIPGGVFFVAEACAGLRFLIASIAFGVLYALLNYRSPGRRITFIAVSIVVPVIANGIRALGIVVLGYVLGSAEAAAADHLIYGWVFFSAVILALTVAGLPFREDREPRRRVAGSVRGPSGRPARAMLAAGLVVILGIAGPAVAPVLDRSAGRARLAGTAPVFLPPTGCVAGPGSATGTWPSVQVFLCGTLQQPLTLTATVQAFAPRSNPAAIIGARRWFTGESGSSELEFGRMTVNSSPSEWQILDASDPDGVAASAVWIDGDPTLGGMRGRIRQAWSSLVGGGQAPVLVAVSVRAGPHLSPPGRQEAHELIKAFLESQVGLAANVTAIAREAGAGL